MKLLERGLDLYKINEIDINIKNKWKWEWLDKTEKYKASKLYFVNMYICEWGAIFFYFIAILAVQSWINFSLKHVSDSRTVFPPQALRPPPPWLNLIEKA